MSHRFPISAAPFVHPSGLSADISMLQCDGNLPSCAACSSVYHTPCT